MWALICYAFVFISEGFLQLGYILNKYSSVKANLEYCLFHF